MVYLIYINMQLGEVTIKFVDNPFREGMLKTTGTDIDKIMPSISRFSGGSKNASNSSEKL